ncbi:MAG: phosphodiesterase [Burkholderiaceae bacterium]
MNETMLIAQLSDTHIRPAGQLYKGVVDSNLMFADAIAHLHSLDRRPDVVILTGDLVDEGHPAEYATLLDLLEPLTIPTLVMPGNHDDRDRFRAAFAGHAYLPGHDPLHYCIDDYPVRIIALDSCVPGRHHGHVDAEGLQWLRMQLDTAPDKPTVLVLHHPPLVSGIRYLDEYRYRDGDSLASVIRPFANIEAVLCGHVHRPMARRWAGTVVLACPSTTTEIALQLREDAVPRSTQGPSACMLHLWQAGHGLVSHTSAIGRFPGPFPFF